MWVYIRVEAQPITTAWIYHNAELGLISLSSDWETWTTITDKNLWATQVYNNWDTLSETNCGKFYQWGNNYWFPFTWAVTTSSTQADASNYWPWNYYSSSTFIIRNNTPRDWSSVENNNLRWDTTWTNEARQWPCATWFHIPTYEERNSLFNIWNWFWIWSSSNWWWMKTYLKMPYAWDRNNADGVHYSDGSYSNFWTSQPWKSWFSKYIRLYPTSIILTQSTYRCSGCSIRPFKNEAVQPDSSREVLYQPN